MLYPEADVFVRGYGEEVLVKLAAGIVPASELAGVHVAGEEDACDQARIDLDEVASPWLTGAIPLEGQRFIRWETQRGCPYKCAFCQHREAGARLKKSSFEPTRIMREIDLFMAHDVEDIAILDPVFNASDHAVAILERFVALGYKGRLSMECRAESITPAFLDAAAKLNVRLQFGLQTIHRSESDAIHRRNHLGRVSEVFADVRARGIDFEVSVIYGLPLQTIASFKETVAWCLDARIPVIKAFPLMLLRGTELERRRAEWQLEESQDAMSQVVASSTFSRQDHQMMGSLSEALKATERKHPAMSALLEIAEALHPNTGRFSPVRVGLSRPGGVTWTGGRMR